MSSIPLPLLLTTSLLLTVSSIHRADAAPDDFVMPSRNIYCALVNESQGLGLRCEILSRLNPRPPQPYRGYCDLDWGSTLLLPQVGKPEVSCVGDTIAGSRYVLQYGRTWNNAGFRCVSQRTGLTCTNASGQGFFLSRERWRAF